MPKDESTHLPGLFLIVGAASALGTILRILLFCGVIIWSIVRVLYICLAAPFEIGMLAIERALALFQRFSQKTAARWIHQ
jgi:hypothetical protein